MIRQLLAAAAITGAVVTSAPLAAADPAFNDGPRHYATDVPNMNYDAHLAGPCDNFELFVFGRGPGGEALQCKLILTQPPPNTTGFWTSSYPLEGVQQIGAPCPNPETAAQAPDGRPLLCVGARGWQPGILGRYGFDPV